MRVGAALYGLHPVSCRAIKQDKPKQDKPNQDKPDQDKPDFLTDIVARLRLVVQVSAPIIQLRVIEVGETVGYAQGWVARRCTLVAVVAFGYGDGYPFGCHLGYDSTKESF